MGQKQISKQYPIRVTVRHKSGCSEWDVYTDFAEAQRRVPELVKSLEADVKHFEQTGRIE